MVCACVCMCIRADCKRSFCAYRARCTINGDLAWLLSPFSRNLHQRGSLVQIKMWVELGSTLNCGVTSDQIFVLCSTHLNACAEVRKYKLMFQFPSARLYFAVGHAMNLAVHACITEFKLNAMHLQKSPSWYVNINCFSSWINCWMYQWIAFVDWCYTIVTANIISTTDIE